MRYDNIHKGKFLSRPNRFIANVEIDGKAEVCHVKIFMEVNGCTLEKDGVVLFPDAPTLRGVKHIEELSHCLDEGYESYIMILVQMSDVKYFTPNYDTHPEFGEALEKASRKGVKILCYDCNVTHDSMTVGKPVKVKLGR